MSTTVVITGSGCPQLVPDRAGPGALVRVGDLNLQFDAGRNTVARLIGLGIEPKDLTALFLTHYHSDHVLGLPDVVLSHWVNDRMDDAPRLPLYAPNGSTSRFCERMLEVWDDDLAVRAGHNHRPPEPKFDVFGFDTPESPTEVWSHGDVRVIAGQVRHEPVVGAVGFRVETPDGVVVISGDTLVCEEMAELAEGADVVVYEAMRFDHVNLRPPHLRYITEYHADTRLIGAQMAALDVSTLMLTHLIPAPSSDEDKQDFIDEVREGGYRGEIVVCDDLDTVTLC
ncbi:MAG: MBL fold metallo-hydrolase [Actinomycetia bacterium]|nr:MBL fold metallo-hydrolase [Actinomycetes bacterium]MCP4962319.1 MBL fold metallo-hydrolase [Actinomycetes bacterium]